MFVLLESMKYHRFFFHELHIVTSFKVSLDLRASLEVMASLEMLDLVDSPVDLVDLVHQVQEVLTASLVLLVIVEQLVHLEMMDATEDLASLVAQAVLVYKVSANHSFIVMFP